MSAAQIAITWSPSTTSPRSSTAIRRSASPSRAMPACARSAVTAAGVDVAPVGTGVDNHDLCPGAAEHVAGDVRGGPVGRVDDHAQPTQIAPLQHADEMLDVVAEITTPVHRGRLTGGRRERAER